nr:hypothetical protein Itr_chr13CG17350 [Ipomoea trifida]
MADGAPGGRERRWWRSAVAVSAPGGRERRWWPSHSRRPWFAKEKLAVGALGPAVEFWMIWGKSRSIWGKSRGWGA